MNLLRITLSLGFLAASIVLVSSEEIEDYDYADNGAPAQQPQQTNPLHRGRSPLLASRQNKVSPLTSNSNKLNKQTGKGALPSKAAAAPAPVPAAQEEPEEEIVEYDENPEEPVEETSTEPPKKTIKPIVRPFRSNDDLLAALKRRRQQVQNSGAVVDRVSTTTSTTAAPSSSNKKSSNSFGSSGRRNRNGGNRSPAPQPPQDEYSGAEPDSARKSSQSRKYNNRSGARSAPAPVLEEIPAEEQPKPKFGRGSRRN